MGETVSVIIPTLNEEQNISGCLLSLINQSEKPFEVVIVDNGSSDGTRDIARGFKEKFKNKNVRFKLFYYPRGNQTNARDFGIRKSKGTIIGSLDADAFADENWVFEILKNFESEEVIGIGGKSKFRNRGRVFNFFYSLSYYLRLLSGLYCLGGGNSAFRKSPFLSVGGYNGLSKLKKERKIKYAKDDFFLSKKLERKGKLKFCPSLNVMLQYRIRNSHIKNIPIKISFMNILKRLFLEINYDIKITKYFREL